MSPLLEYFLIAFIIVLIVVTIIITVYLVKFLKETSKTMISIQELTNTVKTEIEPSLKSIDSILANIKDMSNTTSKHLDTVRKVITTVIGATGMAISSARNNSFINGILTGFNIFSKKRR